MSTSEHTYIYTDEGRCSSTRGVGADEHLSADSGADEQEQMSTSPQRGADEHLSADSSKMTTDTSSELFRAYRFLLGTEKTRVGMQERHRALSSSLSQHTSVYVSIRQHMSAYVSIRQHRAVSSYP